LYELSRSSKRYTWRVQYTTQLEDHIILLEELEDGSFYMLRL